MRNASQLRNHNGCHDERKVGKQVHDLHVQAMRHRVRSIGWNSNSTTVSSHRESLTRPIKFVAIARFRLKYYCHGVDAPGATQLNSQTFLCLALSEKYQTEPKTVFCTKPNRNRPTVTENVKL